MAIYNPPVEAMRFALMHAAGYPAICGLLDKDDITLEMVEPILNESAKFANGVLSPLNKIGDSNTPSIKDSGVVMPPEFTKAYNQYRDTGWSSLSFPKKYGGQDLPQVLSFAVQEMWQSSCLSFGLAPMLNHGAIETLIEHGTEEQKELYVPKLVSGEWTGSMDLTESSAGSDLSSVQTQAVKNSNNCYSLSGQKIFITYGDHDMTPNIVHMVLARIDGAPEGAKGLSLFVVPKFLVNEDGTLGDQNSVQCTSLEHKMGIHACPTCVMKYENATGYLVGKENNGLEYMFTMMNSVRLLVGIQGVGMMERSFQAAKNYAQNRIQGQSLDKSKNAEDISINQHPDIKRMLLTMSSMTDVARCFSYYVASGLDLQRCDEEKIAQRTKDRKEMLTPLVKAWCSDLAVDVTSIGIQVYGGAGYIEETGVCQFYRDARVLPIYEGTNGIQSIDFAFRKIIRDKGRTGMAIIIEMEDFCKKHLEDTTPSFVSFMTQFQESLKRLRQATEWVLEKGANDLDAVACAATPFSRMFAIVVAGYIYAKAVISFRESDRKIDISLEDLYNKLRFFGEVQLPQAIAQLPSIKQSYRSILETDFTSYK